jgi:type I restriction enzyme R subunit
MSFTESNTVEQMILDAVGKVTGAQPSVVRESPPPGRGDSLGGEFRPSRWDYVPAAKIPRQTGDVMVEAWVREALIKLNPEIAAQPDRADEVIYNLRACILSVQADGLVRANENFMAWLRAEKTMPFGANGEHVPVRLVDAVQPGNNRLTVANQWIFQTGAVEKRFDVVFLVNWLAGGHRRSEDAHAQRGDVVRRRVSGERDLREASAGDVRAERLFVRHRGPVVPVRLDQDAD